MGFTLTQQLPAPARHGWNVTEFERLFEAGFFAPDARLELIEGEVWEKMTQKTPHATAVTLAQYLLAAVFQAGFVVRVQLPLIFGETSKPEPDIAVCSGSARDYAESHPATAVLVVEISDTTLVPDQQTKSALYARAGIEEYWIVNLIDDQLEVRRGPDARATSGIWLWFDAHFAIRRDDFAAGCARFGGSRRRLAALNIVLGALCIARALHSVIPKKPRRPRKL